MEFRRRHALLVLLVLGCPLSSRYIHISVNVDLRLRLRSVLCLLRPSDCIICAKRTPGFAVRSVVLPVRCIVLRRGRPICWAAIVSVVQTPT